jgi:hypothetical protein
LASSNPTDVVAALNVLVRLSSDDRLNYALGEGGEGVVDGLVQAFDDALGWTGGNSELLLDDANDPDHDDLNPSPSTWDSALFRSMQSSSDEEEEEKKRRRDEDGQRKEEGWAEFCARRLCHSPTTTYVSPSSRITESEYAILHVVVLIVRNLSYVAANGRYLVHNVGMMRVLTGCLYFRAFERSEEDDRGRAGGANNL